VLLNPTKKLSLTSVWIKCIKRTQQCSTCTMFVMFTDKLFQAFETICSAGRVGISCTIHSARMLHYKFLCCRHFSESDFTTPERVHLNRFAVPCGTDSAAESLPYNRIQYWTGEYEH
jgi:hypothetical protein